MDKVVGPVRDHNGRKKIVANFRQKLSEHSNSFNSEVASEVIDNVDEEGDIVRPFVISHLKDPIRVLIRVIQGRNVLEPLICFGLDKGTRNARHTVLHSPFLTKSHFDFSSILISNSISIYISRGLKVLVY